MMQRLQITIPIPPHPVIDELFINKMLIEGKGDTCLQNRQPYCLTAERLRSLLRRHLVHNMAGFPVGFRSRFDVYILPGVTTFVAHFKDAHSVVRSVSQNDKLMSRFRKRIRLRKFPGNVPPGKNFEPYFLPKKGIAKKRSKLERRFKGNYINLNFYFDNFCHFLFRGSDCDAEPLPFVRSIFVNPLVPRAYTPQGGEDPASVSESGQSPQSSNESQKPELAEGNPQVPIATGSQSQSVCSGFKGTTLPPNFCRGAYFISQSK
jgi:hypothetical protein